MYMLPDETSIGVLPLPCACATLRRATRAVTQMYSKALKHTGLGITQFTVLRILKDKGETMQQALGELLAVDSTTLTRTLKPMETTGLIASRPGENDRREKYFRITSGESERSSPRCQPWKKVQSELKTALGDEAWDRLFRAADMATAVAREQ